jgi:signal transduction histidine kinase
MLKTRIIVVFTSVTIFLIILMALTSYRFVRTIYLNQLTDQVKMLSRVLAGQIDPPYLEMLQIGIPTPATRSYFHDFFTRHRESGLNETVLLFKRDFRIQVSSDSLVRAGRQHPILMLHRKEIRELDIGQATASLPFKSEEDTWYLWGFYRLDQELWMAVRENADRFNKISTMARLFWIMGISGTLLTILAGWLVARAISRPVEKLVSFSAAIGRGEFDTQLPANTPGEIGILARTMGQMRKDLVESQKEKEEMLARIAHEIRNPLGGMELVASLLREDLASAKKSTNYIDTILSEIEGLKALISEYLGYSRPRETSPAWVNIPELFGEVTKIAQTDFHNKELQIINKCELEKIWFDKYHLRQVLLNLVVNAAESVQHAGQICLYAAERKKRWILAIQDNGRGIIPAQMAQVFKPFFTTKNNGTGLGLAISQKLCMENNAVLRLVRNRSGGCTFFLVKQKVGHG